ncbi:MAG TPA: SDR family NAD(P)-dependent oxidoreductase [Candidatus Aphodomonas merdavium]|nr:SDR family NAD(P)-dependent oxidoreductase [Candidatus Aphodomonas merdavium]
MKTVAITGATSGIGLEAARALAGEGYRVLCVGRCEENCEKARLSIAASAPQASVRFFAADLMQQRETLRLAREIGECLDRESGGRLDALVCNAGCARSRYMTTQEGYEQQFALNYLSAFLLAHALLPQLKAAGGRLILTGSGSHRGARVHWDDVMLRKRYNPLTAYKQSKLCGLLFAREFNARYAACGVRAYVVDPGLVNTDIGDKAGGVVRAVWRFRKRHGAPPAVPARTFLFLCGQEPAPQGLYYRLCKEQRYSRRVTEQDGRRLFALSERLCGLSKGGVL